MARKTSGSGCYHVMARGHNRQAIFRDDQDYERYLMCLSRAGKSFPYTCYHFCLMPNHVHLLLQTDSVKTLTALMRRIQQAYQFHWRRRYGLVGHLWQGRFKSLPIEEEAYLLECGRYIERNPIRAGLCQHPQLYRWSSARLYLTGEQNSWRFLRENPLYRGLGRTQRVRQKRYREYVEQTRPYESLVDVQFRRLS